MNQTVQAFGYPESLIKEYDHWVVLLRPQQVTIGSLVIAAKSDVTNLGKLSSDAWTEFSLVTKETEELLRNTFGAEKFNYLALMMVDPNVHFHFIPRYSQPVALGNQEYTDADWPMKTELKPIEVSPEQMEILKAMLKSEV
ncbi:MAG TPA: HIT family protein [Patescibacteria group bacterium]